MSITEEFKKLFNAEDIKKQYDNIGHILTEDDLFFESQEQFKKNCNIIMSNNIEKFKNIDFNYHHNSDGKCVENWYDEYEDNIIQYYMSELYRVYGFNLN